MLAQKPKLLSIGIVLPSDEIETITLSFPDPSLYEIESIKKVNPSCKTPEKLTVSLNDCPLTITPLSDQLNEKSVKISGVPAGRGFHWKKLIEVTLPGKIELKASDDSLMIINDVSVEQYLACVSVSEMSAECPSAFLEAQMTAARSWVLANRGKNHPNLNIDVCNDDCCQRYQGMAGLSEHAIAASQKSAGKILCIGDSICDARYSKSCGGITETGNNVWPAENLKYLESILDGSPSYCGSDFISDSDLSKFLGNVDEAHSYFRWIKEISNLELTNHFNTIHNMKAEYILGMENESVGPSGRILSCDLAFVDSEGTRRTQFLETEYTIRQTLDPSFLFSSAITMMPSGKNTAVPEKFVFTGKGWGHGAGMCQIGALGMALTGKSSNDILKHYFPAAVLCSS